CCTDYLLFARNLVFRRLAFHDFTFCRCFFSGSEPRFPRELLGSSRPLLLLVLFPIRFLHAHHRSLPPTHPQLPALLLPARDSRLAHGEHHPTAATEQGVRLA